MRLRVVFFGSAELSCASLRALKADPNCEVAAVVTQPDKPKGRHLQLQPSPVKIEALESGVPVLQPKRAREEAFINELRELKPDLFVVVAYGQILPQALLDVPRFGALNVHTSILPKYRGAAPIQWAVLNGDAETGVTIMKMDAGLDTGPVLSTARIPILPHDTSATMHDKLAVLGAELLLRTIPGFISGEIQPQAQTGESNYARKIEKEDGAIDWTRNSTEIFNQVRGLTPWPGAFTFFNQNGQPRMLKIWNVEPLDRQGAAGTILEAEKQRLVVACGQGSLLVKELQPEGKKRMTAAEFLAGNRLKTGEQFQSRRL